MKRQCAENEAGRGFHYMLRRTLPLWNWQAIAQETIARCAENGIDEIIWMIDPEDFTHGLPKLDLIEEYLPVLRQIKQMQQKQNIVFSLNPWVTLGHVERGRDLQLVHPDMHWMVGQDGYSAKAIACPLSDGWRRWIAEAYSRYASLSPAVLWMEDDFRLFNHEQLDYGCFCPLHLQAFERETGCRYSREELLAVLLRRGEPHPHRAAWLQMNGRIMNEAVGIVQQAVHEKSASTRLGLMCSDPAAHALEGRNWREMLRAMGEKPVARPSMGSYNEWEPVDVIQGMDCARLTMACLPEDVLVCPELESCFYSTYAKSARHTRLQLGLAALAGAQNLTMNIYDFVGGEISENDPFMRVLKETKPVLDFLAAENDIPETPKATPLAIGIAFDPDGAQRTHTHAEDSVAQMDPRTTGWALPLQACGVPVVFSKGNGCAATGEFFRGMAQESVLEYLSGGLLLDAGAALCLQEMGYGQHLGVEFGALCEQNSAALGAEEFHNPAFGGSSGAYMTLVSTTKRQKFARMIAAQGAQTVSSITDSDRRRLSPLMTAYENKLGGRVAVYGMDMSGGASDGLKTSFLSPMRANQLGAVLRWMQQENSGLQNITGAYQLTFARHCLGYDFVGIANLSTDNLELVRLRLWNHSRVLKAVFILENCEWCSAKFTFQKEILTVHQGVGYKDFIALNLVWDSPRDAPL